MLKFKGTAKELKEFMAQLIAVYGATTTLKELIEKGM